MTKPEPGGGSLLIAWQLKNKTVLIVGGGEVASQRIESILGADARIIVLAPLQGLGPRTKHFLNTYPSRISHRDRNYSGPDELTNVDMVLTALDDVAVSKDIVSQSRHAKIPVNAADIPDACDFYFGAQIRDGPLQIMISTNGNGPRLAALVKKRIQNALSGSEGEAIEKVGQLRNLLKTRAPGVGGGIGRRRMKWMTELCNNWEMEDFTQLNEEMMNRLLDEGWDKNTIPSVQALGGGKRKASLPESLAPTALAFALGAALSAGIFFWRRP